MVDKIDKGEALLHKRENELGIMFYVIIFALIGLMLTFYFLAFIPIDGESMENTIFDNQKCLVQRRCFDVSYGDIVTINTSEQNEKEHIIIKRIIAMSGDKIVFMISEDKTYVDLYICKSDTDTFELVEEPYIKERMRRSATVYENIILLPYTDWLTEINVKDPSLHAELSKIEKAIITVPENSIFFMGDNRNVSNDSRYYGTRTLDRITSKVLLIL